MEDFYISKDFLVRIDHFRPVAVGSDMYRTIFTILAQSPESEKGKVIKRYEVWLDIDAVADRKRIPGRGANENEVLEYAKELLKGRFSDSEGVPDESGIYMPRADYVYLGDYTTFPPGSAKTNKVKTTIMLEDDTLKWLKDYAHQKDISIGETIRRLVTNFRIKQ